MAHSSRTVSRGRGALAPADQLPLYPHATRAFRVARLLGRSLGRQLFRFSLEGGEHIPAEGPFIIIANHLSWIDGFIMQAAFPAEPRLHVMGDLRGIVNKRIQWYMIRKLGGIIFVDRSQHGNTEMFDRVRLCLARRGVVALFPEGACSVEENVMLPFKKGFAHFALNSNVPVLPVGLCGTKDLWVGKPIRIVVGGVISPAGHTVESLTQAGFDSVQRIVPRYVDPGGRKVLKKWLTNLF